METLDKKSESILVFTHRTTELLTKLNASTSWQLNQSRAKKCDYVICVRNSNSELTDDDIQHGSAFLIGKISNVVQSLNLPRDEHRYMIEFNEYSEMNPVIDDVWQGWRSPVIYKPTNELESALGIDFSQLEWKEVPKRDHSFIMEYFEKENAYYESREKVTRKFRQKKELEKKVERIDPIPPIFLNEGLSIADAKSELSKFYGIAEENIEIVLKG